MNYLFVVAHPDDEALGCGGTIHRLISEGNNVAIATMCNKVSARRNLSSNLANEQLEAYKILGVSKYYFGDFPNIKMNTVDHLSIVQFIESCIEDFDAEAIITHHPSDLNNDHVVTSIAAQAAARLFQRKPNIIPLKLFMYMEILSSTDWSMNSCVTSFKPNFFVEIQKEGVEIKIEALSKYDGVMREYPHPRSKENIMALASFRGAQSGLNYAESFECVFWRK